MTSSTTSCESELLCGPDNETSAGEGEDQSDLGRSLSYHSLVDSNKITKRIVGQKRKAEYIHHSKIVTQDDRDKYNKQQRMYRVQCKKNDPNYNKKLREARERNREKVNKYQRDWYQRQTEKRDLATQLGHPLPIKPNKPSVLLKVLTNEQKDARKTTSKAYYRKNSVPIRRKQKISYDLKTQSKKQERKQKIERENRDFEKLKSSERLLLKALKQEAQKVAPTLSNDVLRRFLRHLSSQKTKFLTGKPVDCRHPSTSIDLSVGEIPVTSNKQPRVEETAFDDKRDIASNNESDNHVIRLLMETILLSADQFSQLCSKSVNDHNLYPVKYPNCISSSTQQRFNYNLENNLLNPKKFEKAFLVLDELSWTPVTTTVRKQESQKISITREEFDLLVLPKCLCDSLMDFLFHYLLRGASQADFIYGSLGCSLYQVINKYQRIEDFKGRKRMSTQQNILDNELIFWPLQIRQDHWVLAILLKPKLVAIASSMDQGISCVLYLDPCNKHLVPDAKVVLEGIRDRKKFHDHLLLWLNFELGGDNGSVYDCCSFPLIYDFGDGELIIFEFKLDVVTNEVYKYLL